ncbi:MAG: zinc-finger domain-containing protein [Rhodobacter sp.]|uniref:zinc-finger domain-containing protein n=1 Tax=Pararhodobacter sp. TaxID=2127056 RepID=UPI001DE75B86|nr:zinc-finger domain-containing protein [Pararhodobacter sp.]MCB1346868.1 zinc-finger domain-containing protein [Paracoccaceae bacterium]MCC0074895.1 zinc-finger domain-containing protein [Rhodobacter sp.]HPD90896.1 zinc-finger domain-containing protein [Pararhodobacter sp.]
MSASPAHDAPATHVVNARRFSCDGGEGALGHPRVWLTIPHETGFIDCPYCDARYTLAEGAGDAH